MDKDVAFQIMELLWKLLGDNDRFESMTCDELESLLKLVEIFHLMILELIKDPFFKRLDLDCMLIEFFIIAERNYQETGKFC
jgi:hypothetical protein